MPSRPPTQPPADPASSPAPGGRAIEAALVALLLVIFAALAVGQAARTSATTDEILHLPAGYAALRWGDYRLDPRNPPLVKLLAALPLLRRPPWPAEVEPDPDDVPLGRPGAHPTTLLRLRIAWASALQDRAQEWLFAHLFLYGVRDASLERLGVESRGQIPTTTRLSPGDFENDADQLLLQGRLVVLGLALGTGGLVFLWARTLFGPPGGFLALLLFTCDPSQIAHAALVTTDVGLTLFVFAAVFFLWRACRHLCFADAGLAATAVALAVVTRFSALLLVPVVVLLVLGRALVPLSWPMGAGAKTLVSRSARVWAAVGFLGLAAAAGVLAVWGIYGFRYAAARDPLRAAATEARLDVQADPAMGGEPGHFPIESAVRRATLAPVTRQDRTPPGPPGSRGPVPPPQLDLAQLGLADRMILAAHRHHLLPEAYLYGLASTRSTSQGRGGLPRAAVPSAGPRSHPAWAFLLKTPLPTLALVIAALARIARRHQPGALDAVLLLTPVLAYGGMALAMGAEAGQRQLLTIYPFLYVVAGGLGAAWARWSARWRPLAAALVVGAVVAPAFVILAPPWRPAPVYPHYLAYANELAGDPRVGLRRLVDFDLDRGQDLPALRGWLERSGIMPPVNLSLFGLADPLYYGIPHLNLPGGYPFESRLSFARDDEGRWDVPAARRPGYLAISATNLAGVYLSPGERAAWRALLAEASLVDVVGYSIFVYRLGPRPGTVYEGPDPGGTALPEAGGPGEGSF